MFQDSAQNLAPQIVRKREQRLAGFDVRILALYVRGMSARDIQGHLHLGRHAREWRNRGLVQLRGDLRANGGTLIEPMPNVPMLGRLRANGGTINHVLAGMENMGRPPRERRNI